MFGEMGEVMLLGGQRVVPERLDKAGFAFRYPELEAALRRRARAAHGLRRAQGCVAARGGAASAAPPLAAALL